MTDVTVSLGANKYGKAENRVVRIVRDTPRHEIVDLNVSSQLRGADFIRLFVAVPLFAGAMYATLRGSQFLP